MSTCLCARVLYIQDFSFKVSIKFVLPLSGTGSRSPAPSCTSLIAEYMPGIWALHRKFNWPFEKWNGWRFTLISIHWRFSVWSVWGEEASLRSHLCCGYGCGWWFVYDSTWTERNHHEISSWLHERNRTKGGKQSKLIFTFCPLFIHLFLFSAICVLHV